MLIMHWKAARYFFDEGDCPSTLHKNHPLWDQGKELLVFQEQHQKGMLPPSVRSKEECFKTSKKDDLFLEKYWERFCDAFKCIHTLN